MIKRLPEADAIARRFHQVYDRLYPRDGGHVEWQDMPESYRLRLTTVFDAMVRDGSMQGGPILDMHELEEQAPTLD
jgi:hypothetical protein